MPKWHRRGSMGLGRENFWMRQIWSKFLFWKCILFWDKISNNRALNTQKRQNGGILGGHDVIGGPGGSVGKNFESVEFGQIFHFENVLYFGQNLQL